METSRSKACKIRLFGEILASFLNSFAFVFLKSSQVSLELFEIFLRFSYVFLRFSLVFLRFSEVPLRSSTLDSLGSDCLGSVCNRAETFGGPRGDIPLESL